MSDKIHFISSVYKNRITGEFEYYPWGYGQGYIVKSFRLLRNIIRCQNDFTDAVGATIIAFVLFGFIFGAFLPYLGNTSVFIIALCLVTVNLLRHRNRVNVLIRGVDKAKKPLLYVEYYGIHHSNNIKGNIVGGLMGALLFIVFALTFSSEWPSVLVWLTIGFGSMGVFLALIQLYAHCKLKLP